MIRRNDRNIVISKGGVRLPLWFKKIHAVALDNGDWYFPPRYPFNDHLPASYTNLGDRAWAVTKARYLTLYPQWSGLAALTLAIVAGAVVDRRLLIGVGALAFLVMFASAKNRSGLMFGFAWVGIFAALAAFVHPLLAFLPALVMAWYLYLRWAADVTVIQQSSVVKYWRVIARKQLDGEASSISGREPTYPWPQTLFAQLGIGSTLVGTDQNLFEVGPSHNYRGIQILIRGVDQAMADYARLAAEAQDLDAVINAVRAIRSGQASLKDIARGSSLSFVAKVKRMLGTDDDVDQDATPERTPTAPFSDELPEEDDSADDTPTESIPFVRDDRPQVFVVDESGQTMLKEDVDSPPAVSRWNQAAHKAGLHHPTKRPNPQSGVMQLYCPQCDAVYPDNQ